MEYEICFLVGESREADLDKIKSEVEKIIEKHQGVFSADEWIKKRRLAYEIKKESRGTYVAKRFSLPDKDEREEKFPGVDFIGKMVEDLNFNQDILRFIIVKAEELLSLDEMRKKDLQKEEEYKGKDETAKGNDKVSESGAGKKKKTTTEAKETSAKKVATRKDDGDDVENMLKSEKEKNQEVKETETEAKSEKEKEEIGEVKKTDVADKADKTKAKDDADEEAEKQAKKKSASKKKEISEDEIDEKLDEILNI